MRLANEMEMGLLASVLLTFEYLILGATASFDRVIHSGRLLKILKYLVKLFQSLMLNMNEK